MNTAQMILIGVVVLAFAFNNGWLSVTKIQQWIAGLGGDAKKPESNNDLDQALNRAEQVVASRAVELYRLIGHCKSIGDEETATILAERMGKTIYTIPPSPSVVDAIEHKEVSNS